MQPSNANFCHPYTPYSIQVEFMNELYQCIEDGNVGIFESPTGTGKSLSLICGALTWLRDNKSRDIEETLAGPTTNPDDWLANAEIELRRKQLLTERQELEEKLARLRDDEIRRQGHGQGNAPVNKRARKNDHVPTDSSDEMQYVLEHYDSDAEKSRVDDGTGLSRATRILLDQLMPITESVDGDLHVDQTKVIFCSRTHSQLTQFVHELRRVKPPSSCGTRESSAQFSEAIKQLPLGSRKNLCINEKVTKLGTSTAINERCIELQKPGTSDKNRCPYLPTKDDEGNVNSFRDRAIARVRDIEDLALLGKSMQLCPYYASRSAIAPSEVLTMPYPLLLQKSAREALGVSVKGNVIVIDEAHNLMDAIASTLSMTIRLSDLKLATEQVMAYVQKFKNKLKGGNRVYITQIIRLLNSMTDCLKRLDGQLAHHEIEVTAAELMAGKGVDQIRPDKLARYIQKSKLAYKIEGYTEAHALDQQALHQRGLLMQFESFLMVLMNPAAEGRFFVSHHGTDTVVRYVLLDPREHFRDVVQEARAVILAGGTMSPMSDYADYLFSYLPVERLKTFAFGHIVPRENILVQTISSGPSAREFEFTFAKRKDQSTINELGNLVVQTCRRVPDGVVAFFQSYEYLAQVVQVWKQGNVFRDLCGSKAVFEESKSSRTEDLLREYSQAIDGGQGALMLSVVGGKLSEGINFSDKLGRAVIAIGLPFPNANSGEWKAKIEHVEATALAKCREAKSRSDADCQARAKAAGKDFYENACMRAVNQSIGRAIRHQNDYAVILLVDRRFSTARIRNKLPGWIQGSMSPSPESWERTEESLQDFFQGKT